MNTRQVNVVSETRPEEWPVKYERCAWILEDPQHARECWDMRTSTPAHQVTCRGKTAGSTRTDLSEAKVGSVMTRIEELVLEEIIERTGPGSLVHDLQLGGCRESNRGVHARLGFIRIR